jgi:hypothetical protein
VLLAPITAGCGRGLPPKTDLAEARTALTAALDVWKEGRPVESLRERTPPIDFRDVNWEQGARLQKYEVEKEEPFGVSAKFKVKLHLADKSGTARQRAIVYTVDKGQAVVIRPEF